MIQAARTNVRRIFAHFTTAGIPYSSSLAIVTTVPNFIIEKVMMNLVIVKTVDKVV